MIRSTDILPESNHKVNRLHLVASLFFLALFAFPLLPLKFTNLIFMVIAALTLTAFFVKPVPIGKTLIQNLVFVLPFIPYLVEFLSTGFDHSAHFEFEKKLFFFTAPLIIPVFIQVTGFRNYKLPLMVHAISVSTLALFASVVMICEGLPFNATAYENGAFILRDNFEKISGLHPTYYSLFALFSICILYYASLSANRRLKVCYIILGLILFITVLFLAVRIAFITSVVLLLIMIIKNNMTLMRKFILGFSVIALLALISFSLPSLRNRLSEMTSGKTGYGATSNTAMQRADILHCSLQVFSENIFLGTGSRNFQERLNRCYCSIGFPIGVNQCFNPHNQYLSLGINYGIFLILLFMGCLAIILRKIIKIPEGIYFSISILIFFLSESLLERQMGVYFFGLMGLLMYNLADKQIKKDIKDFR